MQNHGLFKLRLIFVPFLLLMAFLTGPHRAIAASPSGAQARLGPSSGIDSGTRGTYFIDTFESRRSTYIGP